MPRRALALCCLAGGALLLACDRGPDVAGPADAPVSATAIAVPAPDSVDPVAAAAAGAAYRITGPTAEGSIAGAGMEVPGDPALTLFDPTAPRVVTLALVAPKAQRKLDPSMDLFGGADRPWRVQVGPRTDLGRKSGLMLRGGTEGQHNRWDLGASATVGDQSNVQGIVRFHP